MIVYNLSYIIVCSILSCWLGWFIHHHKTQKERKQFRSCEKSVKDLNKVLAEKQLEVDRANQELTEVHSQLDKQKDINNQVRTQIFAEREAGEDTINRLYKRIQEFRKQNQKLKDQLQEK